MLFSTISYLYLWIKFIFLLNKYIIPNIEIIKIPDLNIDQSKFDKMSEEEQLEFLKKYFNDNREIIESELLIDNNEKKEEGKKLINKKKK